MFFCFDTCTHTVTYRLFFGGHNFRDLSFDPSIFTICRPSALRSKFGCLFSVTKLRRQKKNGKILMEISGFFLTRRTSCCHRVVLSHAGIKAFSAE